LAQKSRIEALSTKATTCRICVVGSANVDLTFRTPRLPLAGETLAGRSLHAGMGGKGANQAVAAARLGADVTFVACVGNDSFGAQAVGQYQLEGINTAFIRQDPNQPTGTAAIVVDDAAENCIIIVPGANAGLSPADVRAASSAIQQADAVLCQLETPLDATLEAFRLARAAGKLTVLTPAPVVELPDELLRLCDLCVPNRNEIEVLVGRAVHNHEDAHAAAKSLMTRGVKSVALTLGASGAFLVDDAGAMHIAAVAVDAVDTTGAGDAFTAALAVSLADGLLLNEAAQRASVVAAITVTRIGTQAAFPRRNEVDESLASEYQAINNH
jgi:ribokinase